jgi:serine/tyrosine/threonine adenylyltransferase
MVKGALYTFVRPENKEDPELLGVSEAAMRDIGLRQGEEKTEEFRELVAGNKIFWEEEKSAEGVYPWAQCYGGLCSFFSFLN